MRQESSHEGRICEGEGLLAWGGLAVFALLGWREAKRQRDVALTQKRLALDAIRKLTYEVPGRLKDIPGTLPVLRQLLAENIALLDRITALEPRSFAARREKAVNLTAVGDRWLLLGETRKARKAYESAFALLRALNAEKPQNHVLKRDLSIAYDRLGRIHAAVGRTEEALKAYQAGLAIAEDLYRTNAGGTDALRDLFLGHDTVGGILRRMGRTEEALAHYRAAKELADRRARQMPEDLTAQRDRSLALERIGDIALSMGRTQEAVAAYEESMNYSKQVAALLRTIAWVTCALRRERSGRRSDTTAWAWHALRRWQSMIRPTERLSLSALWAF